MLKGSKRVRKNVDRKEKKFYNIFTYATFYAFRARFTRFELNPILFEFNSFSS